MEDGDTFDYVMLKPRSEILSVRVTVLVDSSQEVLSRILSLRNVKELKEIERKSREFLSLVSHELQSHYASLERELPDELDDRSTEISDLISNLVFYSEIEAGPMRLERRGGDLGEILAASASELQSSFAARGASLEIARGTCPPVLVDHERLDALVKGVLRYVLAHIGVGAAVRAFVGCGRDDPEVHLIFDVNGLELTASEISDLFDKTYQVENFISMLGRQTAGLSLIFLEHIAAAHGGQFSVTPTGPAAVRFCASLRR